LGKPFTFRNSNAQTNISMLLELDPFKHSTIQIRSLKQVEEYYQSDSHRLFQSMKNSNNRTSPAKTDKDKHEKNPNLLYYYGSLHAQLPRSIIEIKNKSLRKDAKYQTTNLFDGLHKLDADVLIKHRFVYAYIYIKKQTIV
jgi:hypothetical protein